jgi:hypothetical protein
MHDSKTAPKRRNAVVRGRQHPLRFGRRHVEHLSPHHFQPSRREKIKTRGPWLFAQPRPNEWLINMILPNSLAFLPGKDTHVGLHAAVERGLSNSLYIPLERSGRDCPLLRASSEHIFIARSASKKGTWRSFFILPNSLAANPGMGAVDLPLRASNEGLLRPRVARAQKIISLHPLFCQAPEQP